MISTKIFAFRPFSSLCNSCQPVKQLLCVRHLPRCAAPGKAAPTRHMAKKSATDQQIIDKVLENRTFSSRLKLLARPLALTVVVSVTGFSGAIVWQYETLRKHVQKSRESAEYDHTFYAKAGSMRTALNSWWNRLSTGERLVVPIIGINLAVFLMWKVKSMNHIMINNFMANIYANSPSRSMFLAAFSHQSWFHIGVNMFVLWNFATPLCSRWGREQFLAVYLSSVVMSGLMSYACALAKLSPVYSLGASGAILGIVGATCCEFPDAKLSILLVDKIFPHSFTAENGLKGLILVDLAGVVFGFRLFDHAAHLGGVFFGIWYHKYGQKIIWDGYRKSLLKAWHELRGNL